jgi:AraC-like DNA-binding protein
VVAVTRDPFSEILELMGARAAAAGGFFAGGAGSEWALRFPPPGKLKLFVIGRGECWLRIEGEAAPRHLREGDVCWLVAPRGFELASRPGVVAREVRAVFPRSTTELQRLGSGDEFLLLCCHVLFSSEQASLVLEDLPAVWHVLAASSEAGALAWLIQALVEEARQERPGASFASTQLAELLFLQVFRRYLADAGADVAGRLRVLVEPRLAPAVHAMHREPGRAWQLEELAQRAAMSRTAFAVAFKAIAGVAPLAYLTEWRMRLAQRELARGATTAASFAELASSLGYGSESAFATAFKRITGTSPGRYRASAQKLRTA